MTLLYTNVFFLFVYTKDGSHQNISANKIYAYNVYPYVQDVFKGEMQQVLISVVFPKSSWQSLNDFGVNVKRSESVWHHLSACLNAARVQFVQSDCPTLSLDVTRRKRALSPERIMPCQRFPEQLRRNAFSIWVKLAEAIRLFALDITSRAQLSLNGSFTQTSWHHT